MYFSIHNKLQVAAFSFITSHLASYEEKKEVMETFQVLDKNGDGKLSKDELIDGCKELGNFKMSKQDIERVFEHID